MSWSESCIGYARQPRPRSSTAFRQPGDATGENLHLGPEGLVVTLLPAVGIAGEDTVSIELPG